MPNLKNAKLNKYLTRYVKSLSASARVTRGNKTFGRVNGFPLKNLKQTKQLNNQPQIQN